MPAGCSIESLPWNWGKSAAKRDAPLWEANHLSSSEMNDIFPGMPSSRMIVLLMPIMLCTEEHCLSIRLKLFERA
jgi:hypothetical protein